MGIRPQSTTPQLQQDLIGNVVHGYSDRHFAFVFGRSSNVNNTLKDLWEGPTNTYVFPTTPQRMALVSTNANDTATGTGVRKVALHYLDANYIPYVEEITLNGTTPVLTTATNIFRVNRLHSVTVGSNGAPLGNVSLTNLAGTVTYGFFAAGLNRARQAIFTVPANKVAYINHWQASSGSNGTNFCQTILRATAQQGILYPDVFLIVDEVGTQNGSIAMNFPIPIMLPPKTDIKMSVISSAANANAIAIGAIMGWLEEYSNG